MPEGGTLFEFYAYTGLDPDRFAELSGEARAFLLSAWAEKVKLANKAAREAERRARGGRRGTTRRY